MKLRIGTLNRAGGLLALGLLTMAASAQWSNPADEVPAYHAAPPSKPLPPLMTGEQLTGPYFTHPYQVTAYKMAEKIPGVLHQLPCYCRCDRALGHKSLHSCFEGTHGAQCSTCLKELYYSYEQHQKGKTAAQIRAGIMKGEWKQIDLLQASTMN